MPFLRLLTIVFFCVSYSVSARVSDVHVEHLANKAFNNKKYYEALEHYSHLDSIHPEIMKYNARLGICYYYADYPDRALHFLKIAHEAKYHQDNITYYLARAYHLNHQFDEAISFYQKAKIETHNKEKISNIERFIQNCNFGKLAIKSPSEVTIENMGISINSIFDEYAPNISIDESTIIFTSKRAGSTGNFTTDDGDFFEDILVSHRVNNQWTEPVSLGNHINTTVNDANINLSFDGGKLFIFKNDSLTGNGDIYLSHFIQQDWTKPTKLDTSINSMYRETSACFSPKEDFILFTSDRPGGFGGMDIYYSIKDNDGKWSKAINVGSAINTSYDEEAPFLHADGRTLYFSSEGHDCIGGFDVFTSTIDVNLKQFSQAKNLGFPINTAEDELSFVWSADGSRGYFATFRPDSYGERDLYVINRKNIKMALIVMNGRVTGKNNAIIPSQIIIVDNKTGKQIAYYDSTKFMGDYTVTLEPGHNYGVFIEAKDYLTYSENINIPINEFYEFKRDVQLVPIDKGGIIVLNNTFFKKGESKLQTESIPELDRYLKLIKTQKNIVIEIAGHAFDFGDDHQANYELSQKRAEEVVKYLVARGASQKNLKAMGYGDLLHTSSKISRTELIILQKLAKNEKPGNSKGYYNEKGLITANKEIADRNNYLKENEKDFFKAEASTKIKSKNYIAPTAHSVKGKVNKTGKSNITIYDQDGHKVGETTTDEDGHYATTFDKVGQKKYMITTNQQEHHASKMIDPMDTVDFLHLTPIKLEKGHKIILHHVYFEFNSASISPNSFKELNRILIMMRQYPNVKIEIGGHTDAIGTLVYNKKLSLIRAEAVKNYLMLKGIAAERLLTVGYGKEHPLASNDDEQEGRELNRRTEIKILEFY